MKINDVLVAFSKVELVSDWCLIYQVMKGSETNISIYDSNNSTRDIQSKTDQGSLTSSSSYISAESDPEMFGAGYLYIC